MVVTLTHRIYLDIVLFITARNVLLHNVMVAMSFCVPKQYYNDLLLTFFLPYSSLEEEDIIQLVHVLLPCTLSFLLSGTSDMVSIRSVKQSDGSALIAVVINNNWMGFL